MELVKTDKAPKAIGPYSQAVVIDGWVFTSGQIPIDPKSGELIKDTFENQVKQVLTNLENVLIAAGTTKDRIVKVTIYLTDLSNFKVLNEIYSSWLNGHKPARSTVQVAKLPLDVDIEIDLIAKL